tara:strand:- start:153 stop:371 length:219 start_codon:yes stop_codon:yes gene_type:complete
MPHKETIAEGSMVKRDQTGAKVLLKRYERKSGKLIPVIQFPSKVLASGKLKPSVEWKCPSMGHFQLHYSAIE